MMNRLANASNRYQGTAKRVLCVCSAGLLRSPTTAWVLGNEPFNYNTRAAGIEADYALIVVDKVLLTWADEIVCMNTDQQKRIIEMLQEFMISNKPVVSLNIPDEFPRMHPDLIRIIKDSYSNIS